MKKYLIAAAAVALGAIAAPAYAQSIDGSIGVTSFDTYGVNLTAAQGILSWRSASFFGAEAEGAVGFGSENIAPGVDIELNFEFAGYATATADINNNVALFGRVGYASLDVENSLGLDLGDDGLAWGLGAKVFLDGVNGVRLDYTKYDFDNDTDVYAIAYVRRF